MGLESVTGIWDLNAANPAPGDNKSEGDDHIRNLKKALKQTFPNINKPITKSADALNQANRVAGSRYETVVGENPMFEMHWPGKVAYAWLAGSDSRAYFYTTGGNGNLSNLVMHVGPGGDLVAQASLYTPGSVTGSYFRIVAPGAVSFTFAINGRADRTLHRNADAMGFLGLDGNWNMFSHDNGDLWARGNISAFSDERYKRDWREITDEQLLGFSRIKYCGIYTTSDTDEDRMGISAQKMKKFFPEAVTKNEGKYGVAYGQAALALVHKLSQKVFELERELRELKK